MVYTTTDYLTYDVIRSNYPARSLTNEVMPCFGRVNYPLE